MSETELRKAEAAQHVEDIAAIYDHPSVYMGGPSNQAKRIAKEVAKSIRALSTSPATGGKD